MNRFFKVVMFFLVIFLNCKNNNVYSSNNADKRKWDNVLDGEEIINEDKTINYDGKNFIDEEVMYNLKIPDEVYLEYSHNNFISDYNIIKNIHLDKYANKYFIRILKANLELDYGKGIYDKILKKYEQNYGAKKSSVIVFNDKIIGEVDELLKDAIEDPFADIHFIKNGYWIAIYIGYFSLGKIQNKYPQFLERSNEPDMVGHLVWKKNIIKLIKEKPDEAPPELVKLYRIFNEVLNSLTFDDGKYEILWK